MRYIILITILILTGFTTLQNTILNKYAWLDVPVNIVKEMPEQCEGLEGCTIVKTYKTYQQKDVYISEDAVDFEDVLAHELLHYYYTNETEEEIIRLTPYFKDYINKQYVRY